MILRRALLWLLPIAALSALGLAILHKPLVEAGLQVAKSGVVVDAQTRQPLAGAYVVVRWLEQSDRAASTAVAGQCLHRSIVRTDEQGHYSIPAVRLPLASERALTQRRYFWDAYAYAPGFGAVAAGGSHHPRALASATPDTQALEALMLAANHAAPMQRIETLADTLSHFACEPYAKPEVNPVADEIYAEAWAAACLPEPNDAARELAKLRGDSPGSGVSPCQQFRQAGNTP